jgi:hypothetical protein
MEYTADRLSQSPFAIPREDVVELCADEGLRLLRNYLAQHVE